MSDQTPDLSTLLAECEQAYQKMTPGPWRVVDRKHVRATNQPRSAPVARTDCSHGLGAFGDADAMNAEGIVTLVNAYPYLRDEIVRLREALRSMLLSADAAWTGGHDWHEACQQARAALTDAPAPQETTE